MRRGWVAVWMVMLLGCAGKGAPGRSGARATRDVDVEALRAEVAAISSRTEAVLLQQDEALWKQWTTGVPPALEDFGTRPSPEEWEPVAALLEREIEPARALRAKRLKAYLTGESLARLPRPGGESGGPGASATAAGTSGAPQVDPFELSRALSLETSAERRRALYRSALEGVEKAVAARQRWDEAADAVVKRAGYADLLGYAVALREVDPEALKTLAEEVLRATQPLYDAALEREVKTELRMSRSAVGPADLPRMFRPPVAEELFPRARLVPELGDVAKGLGVALEALPGLTLDTEDRPGKHTRPIGLGVRVPGDVRLSVKPSAGYRAWAAALHELGNALFLAHAVEGPFEVNKLGPATMGEAHGFLFEAILESPTYWEERLEVPSARHARLRAAVASHGLFRLREDAARILHVLTTDGASPTDARERYRTLSARAYGVPFDEDAGRFEPLERDGLLASAVSLLARLQAAEWAESLEKAHGPTWWRSPGAGQALRELWPKRQAGEVRLEAALSRLERALGAPASTPSPASSGATP